MRQGGAGAVMTDIYDVVVIGAGPVGLYAGFFAAENKFRVAIVDSLPDVGGQLTALYPQKFIFDVAGYPQVTATELVDKLKRQVLKHHVSLLLEFKVVGLSLCEDQSYRIISEQGREIRGRHIIMAVGAGLITPRKLELPEAERFEGRGLEYVIKNVEEYRHRRVLIVGGGDTALDWANYMVDVASEVTLIHRSEKFVGFEGSLQKLRQSSCTVYTDTKLTTISGEGKVERVQVTNSKEGWSKELEIERILGCIGFTPKLGFIKDIGFEITEGSIRADGNMRTSVANIYAVGDISNHPGRIKLISTGFGNVQIAINDISRSSKSPS
jgi:ferredoxin/flavodoxin---NADP+ reductase